MKCGEIELAIDLYKQMGREGLPRSRSSYAQLVDAYVKVPPAPRSADQGVTPGCALQACVQAVRSGSSQYVRSSLFTGFVVLD